MNGCKVGSKAKNKSQRMEYSKKQKYRSVLNLSTRAKVWIEKKIQIRVTVA